MAGTLLSEGGNSTVAGNGGIGQTVAISTAGGLSDINLTNTGTNVITDGGGAANGTSAAAGPINVQTSNNNAAANADVTIAGKLSAIGGDATVGSAAAATGGNVMVNTNGGDSDILLSNADTNIITNGGSGSTGAGNAGTITIDTDLNTADIVTNGTINALGGNNTATGNAGTGNTVTYNTNGTTATIQVNGNVTTNGGNAVTGNAGQAGGVSITTTGTSGATVDINANTSAMGGNSTTSGLGGNGNTVGITTDGTTSQITIDGTTNTTGGTSVNSTGGAGGAITIDTGLANTTNGDGSFILIGDTTASGITFNGGQGATGGNAGSLTINADGNDADIQLGTSSPITGNGGVGTAGNGGNAGTVAITADADYAGALVNDTADVVIGSTITVNGGVSDAANTGGNGGTITLQAAAGMFDETVNGFFALPNGLLILNGDLSANAGNAVAVTTPTGAITNLGNAGAINLNTVNARNTTPNGFTMPGVATIIGTKAGTLSMNVAGTEGTGSLAFGAREKFTNLGATTFNKTIASATSTDIGRPMSDTAAADAHYTINTNGGSLTFSDLTIDGDFLIQGDWNNDYYTNFGIAGVHFVPLAARTPQPLLHYVDKTGDAIYDTKDVTYDQGLDVVVNGSISWKLAVGMDPAVQTAHGNVDPQFALPVGEDFSGHIHSTSGYIVRYLVDNFRSPVYTGGGVAGAENLHILDLKAEGVTIAEPAWALPYDLNDTIRDRMPNQDLFDAVDNNPMPTPSHISELENVLGLGVHQPTNDELRGLAGDHAWFNDMPSTLDATDASVNAGRLPMAQASNVLKTHGSLFYVDGEVDPETGELTRIAQNDHLREVLAGATQNVTANSTAADIRSMVDGSGDEAASIMQQLDQLVDQIQVMGLTPRELNIVLENLLANITPGSITVNQLLGAIQTDVTPVDETEVTFTGLE
ncbi:MAG: hypothetical protein JKX85_05330 [Phycisphaeraceae bacterium]|nr:hypothetical protein [Phycisphaeraceae bacterium]